MFQSGTFWLMLLGSVAVFWSLPQRLRIGFLAAASIAYMATLAPWSVLALVGWTLLFYCVSPLLVRVKTIPKAAAQAPGCAASAHEGSIAKDAARTTVLTIDSKPTPGGHSWLLPVMILAITGYLLLFKYVPPLAAMVHWDLTPAGLILPLGISYFTFKFIHYAIEVSRGSIKSRSFGQFLCYIFLFPTFTAGPIERFDHFLANQETSWSLQMTVEGVTRIIHGLIKKFAIQLVLLPTIFAGASQDLQLAELGDISTVKLWAMGVYAYLSLYMDFSAYSDLAIGSSRLFGLRIMENFNLPVLSPNIGTFWKRWHMTLAGWCQSYIYMPVLGVSRSPYLALYATFITIGLWHAAAMNWLFWGVYHATGITVFQAWTRFRKRRKWTFLDHGLWKYAGIPLTFAFVSVGEIASVEAVRTPYAVVQVLARLVFITLPA